MNLRDDPSLPKSVRIGHRIFKFEFHDNLLDEDDKPIYGEADLAESVIKLENKMDRSTAGEIIIHEAMHAAWYFMNLPDPCNEEDAVSCLARTVVMILQQNKKLISWITRKPAKT